MMAFELHRVSFSYARKKVIRDVSLELAPQRFHGIIGPNGCGKTTVLDLLTRHKQAQSGRIEYRGKRLGQYSRKQLAKEIALVPQNFYINFPYTVRDIVMMGRYPHMSRFSAPSAEDYQVVDDIMTRTEVIQFRKNFITELSGGERQRVIFARALAQDTPVLLLDEATSNLDINHTLGLLKLAARGVKHAGKTVVAVLQDINLAGLYCDNLIFMKDGGIVAHGPVPEVLNSDTIYSVFNVEARITHSDFSGAPLVIFRD
jgi:iron complex transport system ATP-binding protein